MIIISIVILCVIAICSYIWNKKHSLKVSDSLVTKEERKALMFYRRTKCNWGSNYNDEEMVDNITEQISDEEYIKHLRNTSESKD